MYRPVGANQKDVSTRLMKPTRPEIRVKQVLRLVRNWNSTWDYGGEVTAFDGGIAQFLLVGDRSHDIFFASLILDKRSLRCKLVHNEPRDILDEETDNTFYLSGDYDITKEERKKIDYLTAILGRRGYLITEKRC